jgi:hypothetical protein
MDKNQRRYPGGTPCRTVSLPPAGSRSRCGAGPRHRVAAPFLRTRLQPGLLLVLALVLAPVLVLTLVLAMAAPSASAADVSPPAPGAAPVCMRVRNLSGYVLGVERVSGDWLGLDGRTVLAPGQAAWAVALPVDDAEADAHWGSPMGVRVALVAAAGSLRATPAATRILVARIGPPRPAAEAKDAAWAAGPGPGAAAPFAALCPDGAYWTVDFAAP